LNIWDKFGNFAGTIGPGPGWTPPGGGCAGGCLSTILGILIVIGVVISAATDPKPWLDFLDLVVRFIGALFWLFFVGYFWPVGWIVVGIVVLFVIVGAIINR
jgi:hypothetical protein